MLFIAKDQLTKLKANPVEEDEDVPLGGIQVPTIPPAQSQKAKDVLIDGTRQRRPLRKMACADEKPENLEDVVRPQPSLVAQYLPIAAWLPALFPRKGASAEDAAAAASAAAVIKADVIAGLTVAVMLIPQAMSYASLAGLPFVVGLYASFIPIAVYCLFGYSKQLAVGPVAMVSLLVSAGLQGVLTEEECPEMRTAGESTAPVYMTTETNERGLTCAEEYVRLANLTCFMVGAFQVVAHALGLDFFVHFIGHHVVSGFTSGAAILIAMSQVSSLVGYKIPKGGLHEMLAVVFGKIEQLEPYPFCLGLLFILTLLASRRLAQKNATYKKFAPLLPLTLCIIGTVFVIGIGEEQAQAMAVDYVGYVPDGLPDFRLGAILEDITLYGGKVLGAAVSASLIGFMESIAIAKSIASRHGEDVPAGQEMFALGASNLLGSLLGAYPVAGSFSRSAVADSVGSRSQLAGLVTAFMIFISLLFLTPIFYSLPKFCLAAIVISSVLPLIAYHELGHLWKIKKADALLWFLAFVGTLFLGVIEGISLAIGMSLMIIIMESTRPQIGIMWRLPGTTIYRSVKTETSGVFVPNVLILRVGGSMYFANAGYIKESILNAIEDLQLIKMQTKYVILEMTPVITIDSTAVRVILDLVRDFSQRGIYVSFAAVGNRVERTMRTGRVFDTIKDSWFHDTVHTAVLYCLRHQAKKLLKDHGIHRGSHLHESDTTAQHAPSNAEEQAGTPPAPSSVRNIDVKKIEVDLLNDAVLVNGEQIGKRADADADARQSESAPGKERSDKDRASNASEQNGASVADALGELAEKAANEVGFSNTLDARTTVFNVSTSEDRVGILTDVAGVFVRYNASIKRCQVDSLGVLGTRHSYNVVDSKTNGKFSEELGQRIASDILDIVEARVEPVAPSRGTTSGVHAPSGMHVLEEHAAATEQLMAKFKEQQEQLKALGMRVDL